MVSMTDKTHIHTHIHTCIWFLQNTKSKRRTNSQDPKHRFKKKPTGDLYYMFLFCMYNTYCIT